MVTKAFVPLKIKALPYLPEVVQVAPLMVPLFPSPDASLTTVPLPSLNPYAATRPGVGVGVGVGVGIGCGWSLWLSCPSAGWENAKQENRSQMKTKPRRKRDLLVEYFSRGVEVLN
jgi:hypothetical protein